MSVKYLYNGLTFDSEQSIRDAIWVNERKIFGSPENKEEWEALGVELADVKEEPLILQESNLEDLKNMKLFELKTEFETYRNSSNAFIISSLGFKVNSNIASLDNVRGLVSALEYRKRVEEMPVVDFKDFDGNIQKLSLEQMELIHFELITNNSHIYEQKWMFKTLIEQAKSESDLDSIGFKFYPASF